MKKAAIAGIVVALGAVWTGSAWYTGKKAETFVKQLIQDGNVDLQKFGERTGVTPSIELISFERGVFSSTERYRVKFSIPAKDGKPGHDGEIEFVEYLDHGPFPLSNLSRGKLAPAMVASRFQLVETPSVKEWFAAAKGSVPLSGSYSVSYGKNVDGKFDLAAVEFAKDANSLKFSGMKGDIEVNTGTKHAVFNAQSDSLVIAGKSDDSDITSMALQGLTIAGNGAPGKSDMYMGSQKIGFKALTINSATQPPVIVKDTSMAIDTSEADAGVNAKAVLDFGMINVQNQDVTGVKFALDMKNLDPKALKALNEVYEKASHRMLQSGGEEKTPQFTPEEQQILKDNVQLLLAGNPSLSVAPLQLRTANGASTFNLDLNLAKPASLDAPFPDVAMQTVRKLDAKVVLSKASLADLMAFKAQQDGAPADQALKTAKGQADMVGTMAGAMGLAKVENDNVVSYLNYADGQVDFNGKKMPLEQFLMMAMGGFMGKR